MGAPISRLGRWSALPFLAGAIAWRLLERVNVRGIAHLHR
jgi:hypothetical protein